MSVRRPARPPRAARASVRASRRTPTTGARLLGKRECERKRSGQNSGEDDATGSRGRDAVRPVPRRPTSRGRLNGVQRSRAGGGARKRRAAGDGAAARRLNGGRRGEAAPVTARVAGGADAAGRPVPGRSRRGRGHQLRAVGGRGGGRRAVPVRRGGARRPGCRLTELTHEIWHGFVPGVLPGPALRLPGARPLGPVDRRPLEPGEAAPRPVRARRGRRVRAAAGGVRARPRLAAAACRRHRARRPGLGAVRPQGRRRPRRRPRRWADDRRPKTPWADSVIYELHVRGFTMLHPGIPEELRGTYAGLAHPAAIEHLVKLGVTAVELLPVHQFAHEDHLLRRGPEELLGLQLHRLLRAARGVRVVRDDGAAGRRVQADGAGAARGRDRGHPRRGLQPHGGGGRAGPDAVAARASTTGATTGSRPTPAATPTTPAAATPCTWSSPMCCG